jgi:hypothetical protein
MIWRPGGNFLQTFFQQKIQSLYLRLMDVFMNQFLTQSILVKLIQDGVFVLVAHVLLLIARLKLVSASVIAVLRVKFNLTFVVFIIKALQNFLLLFCQFLVNFVLNFLLLLW